MGVNELNIWFYNSAQVNFNIVGSNALWLKILGFFNLVPIFNSFQIFGIIFISKILQFAIYFYIYTIIGKKGDFIFAFSFLPNVFIFSMTVSRSSLDYALFSLIAVLSIFMVQKQFFSVMVISLFFKTLIVLIGIVSFLSDRLIKNKYYFLVFSSIILILIFIFQNQIIELTNLLYLQAAFGNYSFNQNEIINVFDLLSRSFQLVTPSVFYYQNIISFIFSFNYFIFYFYIYFYRKYLTPSDIFILMFYSLFSMPFVYNFFAVARYSSAIFLFILIRLILRKEIYSNYFKY